MIIAREGCSIPTIFATHGEEYFRAAEAEAVRLLALKRGDVIATGGTALVMGDNSGNRITLACGRAESAGGDDVVRQGTLPSFLGGDVLTTTCSVEVDGGPGRDRITGSLGPDVLVGGPGVDRVDGLAGRDRCVAERRVRCER